jgi:hypothetical protein
MTYLELLQTREWAEKRKSILQRDQIRCRMCSNQTLVKEARFIASASIKEANGWFVIQYFDPVKQKIETRFSSIEHTVTNPAVTKFDLFTVSIYVQTTDDKDFLAGVRLFEPDWEYVLKEVKDSLLAKYPVFSPDSIEEELRRHMDENTAQRISKEWYFIAGLNVHHHYYTKGKRPWEYPDDALETLCRDCHIEVHKTKVIPYYSSDGSFIMNLTPCDRCGGHGIIPPYSHVQDGICFKCRGARYLELI